MSRLYEGIRYGDWSNPLSQVLKLGRTRNSPEYVQNPYEQQVSAGIMPSATNPIVQRAAQDAWGRMNRAGYGQANAAAASNAATNEAIAGILPVTQATWEQYQNLMEQIRRARSGIRTTSSDAAFLQGAFGALGGIR